MSKSATKDRSRRKKSFGVALCLMLLSLNLANISKSTKISEIKKSTSISENRRLLAQRKAKDLKNGNQGPEEEQGLPPGPPTGPDPSEEVPTNDDSKGLIHAAISFLDSPVNKVSNPLPKK